VKIRALVQSEQWLNRAGVRIRYRRIASPLQSLGARFTVDVIDNLPSSGLVEDDVVIFSKCTDTRALMAADLLRDRGILVGVDLFDDYFSPTISPCHSHREFLREMASRVDFFLCSTERMRAVGREFAPEKPAHVLNDPFDTLDKQRLARCLREKSQQALATKRLDIVWFGNGDNPVFPVGLTDLTAYAPALQPLLRSSFDVRLKVLTNARALRAENLARLRAMPLPVTIEEWSEEAERQAWDDALISFLPVNHQNFSIAKSLNRGISALTGGTQILSVGFDLYGAIGDFVYHDAQQLLVDLTGARLRLRAETLSALQQTMVELAEPTNEASRLLAFLRSLTSAHGSGARLLSANMKILRAVLHGRRSPRIIHNFARNREILSIGSPFCAPRHRFDLAFDFGESGDRLQIFFGPAGVSAVTPEVRALLRPPRGPDAAYPYVMDLPEEAAGRALRSIRPFMVVSRAGQMVHYARTMAVIEAFCATILPGMAIVRSELEAPLLGMSHLESQIDRASYASQ
jgi:hypothetical protein